MLDFVNFSAKTCKRLMLAYQDDGDYEVFHALLARYDRYLLSVIYQFQRKVWSLKEEELQSLYHTAILGFVKSILAVTEDSDAKYLCNHIKMYILSELKQVYLSKNHTDKIRELILTDSPYEDPEDFKRKLSVKLLLESSILTESDRNLLKSHYFDGKTTRTIGKELNLSQPAIVKRLRKARQKLKDNIYK